MQYNDSLEITINNKNYIVYIIYKRIKNIHFKYDINNLCFIVTMNRFSSKKTVKEYLEKNGEKLIKKTTTFNDVFKIKDVDMYIFGDKYSIIEDKNLIFDKYCFFNNIFYCYDKNCLNLYLNDILGKYIRARINDFYKLMNIEPYNLQFKFYKTIYGCNNRKTRTLSFSNILVRYSKEIIDSIILHELAHDKYRNHQKEFYNYLLMYCPNYYKYNTALRKRNYGYRINK